MSASKRTPFFQTSKVMAAILACQGEPRQMRLHASGDAGLVTILPRSTAVGSVAGSTDLKDIFRVRRRERLYRWTFAGLLPSLRRPRA